MSAKHRKNLSMAAVPSGRMDTPPRISEVRKWEELNPNGYIGRMNTPIKVEPLQGWEDFKEPNTIGRMNTPGPAPDKIFCPHCGKPFTRTMRHQLIYRKPYYCVFCGTEGSFF